MEPHPHTIFIVCHFLLSSASISLSLSLCRSLPFTHPPIEASEIKLSVSNSMHLLQPFNKNKCFLFSLSTVCVAFDGRCSGFGAMGGLGHLTISLYKWIIWMNHIFFCFRRVSCESVILEHFSWAAAFIPGRPNKMERWEKNKRTTTLKWRTFSSNGIV